MSNLWMPPERADKITIYVDETYLHRHSGVIKAGITIHDDARAPFEAAMKPLLAARGHEESKGGKISRGNVSFYRQFLRFVVNVMAETGQQTPLRSIVSLESMHVYKSKLYEDIKRMLTDTFARVGAETTLVSEMAEVIVWCCGHLRFALPCDVTNPLAIIVDEKYRGDLKIAEEKWLNSPALGFATPVPLRQILPKLLNIVLKQMRTAPKFKLPAADLVEIDCVRSADLIYLQAADVFSNLAFNYLLYLKGARSELTNMKYELLAAVMVDGGPSSEVMDALKIVDEGEAGMKLMATKRIVARVTLHPGQTTIVEEKS